MTSMMPRGQRRHVAMMLRGTGQAVALVGRTKRCAGQVRIAHWDRPARTLRAVVRLGILWGLAAISVLVPVLHFVLVPALLIAGPIAAFARFRQRSGVLGGEGECPACGGAFEIDATADEWPLSDVCQACGAAVRILKEAATPEENGGS